MPARQASALALCLALLWTALPVFAADPPAAPDPAAALRSGPVLGPAEMTRATVWLQTWRPERIQIRYWPQGRPEAARLSEEIRTAAAGDHIARFVLDGLGMGGRYEYEVYLGGARIARPYPLTFQTQPGAAWLYDGGKTPAPTFRFAVGSCAYVNDPPFDRPGEAYGGDYGIFESIAAQKPDFMLWLGDNVYYREADWQNEAAMRYRYAHTRSLPEMQALFGATHSYAIWDDHDYGPNDSDLTYPLKEASLRIFQDYWMNPSYGTATVPGVFTRFDWADVDFFLLDDRYHRSPNKSPAGPDRRMFGRAQMDWLKASLANSRATFKIVVGGNQILNPVVLYEGMGAFPAEQKELIDYLRQARISGVLFVTGDRHLTELIRRTDFPGLYPLYDFTSSPLTSGAVPTQNAQREADNPARVPGTWVTGARNFGMIEVSGPRDDRVLTLRTLDVQGQELWKKEIRASELKFP